MHATKIQIKHFVKCECLTKCVHWEISDFIWPILSYRFIWIRSHWMFCLNSKFAVNVRECSILCHSVCLWWMGNTFLLHILHMYEHQTRLCHTQQNENQILKQMARNRVKPNLTISFEHPVDWYIFFPPEFLHTDYYLFIYEFSVCVVLR